MPEIIQTPFTPYASLLGGVFIGLSIFLLYFSIGKIAGISGIISGVMTKATAWRIIFLLGILLSSSIYHDFVTEINPRVSYPIVLSVLSGLLVGMGTILGNGCTSGHGVCGVARFSVRSIVATCLFCTTAIATVFIMQLW